MLAGGSPEILFRVGHIRKNQGIIAATNSLLNRLLRFRHHEFMFPYDPVILAAVQNPPQTIPDVLQGLQAIDGLCVDEDSLKWFNGLYLAVTQAAQNRVNAGGFTDPAWLAQLDVQFAQLYFNTVRSALTNTPCPGCWEAMFSVRENLQIARIQFALAGTNAHINHDLCLAIDATCKATAVATEAHPLHEPVKRLTFVGRCLDRVPQLDVGEVAQ